jgi:hypothetical protein
VKDLECKFCYPRRKISWREDGFYGFQCVECKQSQTAFVVLEDHKNELTPEEEETMLKLVEKNFPDMIPKGVKNKSTISNHWYAFLVKKKEEG